MRVSNDNPFSESAFKTQKYQPDYPGRFAGSAHANRWCGEYFPWYNLEHHHAGLAGFTPGQVHTGRFREIAVCKQQALDAQYPQHPERFVRGRPIIPMPPTPVAINPVIETDGAGGNGDEFTVEGCLSNLHAQIGTDAGRFTGCNGYPWEHKSIWKVDGGMPWISLQLTRKTPLIR